MITFREKVEKERGSKINEKIRIDVTPFSSDVKQVLQPSGWINKFRCTDDYTDASMYTISH